MTNEYQSKNLDRCPLYYGHRLVIDRLNKTYEFCLPEWPINVVFTADQQFFDMFNFLDGSVNEMGRWMIRRPPEPPDIHSEVALCLQLADDLILFRWPVEPAL